MKLNMLKNIMRIFGNCGWDKGCDWAPERGEHIPKSWYISVKVGWICNICGEQIYGKACVVGVIELNQQILKSIRGMNCCPINR